MNSKTTSDPSSSFDLEQALGALRDLVETVRLTPDPRLLSAWHQARLVLRRGGITITVGHAASETVPSTN